MKKFCFVAVSTLMLSIVSIISAQEFKNSWTYSSAPETIGKYAPDYVPSGEGLTVEIGINSVTMFGTTYLVKRAEKNMLGKIFKYELINENDSDKVFNLTMVNTDYNRYYLRFSKDDKTIGFDGWKNTTAKNIRVKQYQKSTYNKSTKTWSKWSEPKKYKSLVTLYNNNILFSDKYHGEYRTYSTQYFNGKRYQTGIDDGVSWKESRHSGFDGAGNRIEILIKEYSNEEYELTIIYSNYKIKYKTFIK